MVLTITSFIIHYLGWQAESSLGSCRDGRYCRVIHNSAANQAKRKNVGFLNSFVYSNPGVFQDVTQVRMA